MTGRAEEILARFRGKSDRVVLPKCRHRELDFTTKTVNGCIVMYSTRKVRVCPCPKSCMFPLRAPVCIRRGGRAKELDRADIAASAQFFRTGYDILIHGKDLPEYMACSQRGFYRGLGECCLCCAGREAAYAACGSPKKRLEDAGCRLFWMSARICTTAIRSLISCPPQSRGLRTCCTICARKGGNIRRGRAADAAGPLRTFCVRYPLFGSDAALNGTKRMI